MRLNRLFYDELKYKYFTKKSNLYRVCRKADGLLQINFYFYSQIMTNTRNLWNITPVTLVICFTLATSSNLY